MILIGLTGGIASGKTLVSDRFAHHGACVIDADQLAREVVVPGSRGLNALITHFGTGILTPKGELDRTALRNMIFANPPDRAAVDGILHPRIRELSEQRIDAARAAGRPFAIYAVPLLVETDQVARFDRIAVVDVPIEMQLSRIMNRDGSDRTQAQAILDAQATREQRAAIADDLIDNSGSIDATYDQVDALQANYTRLGNESQPGNA